MEGNTMTLAKLSNNWLPSVPSFMNRFLEGDLMDWNSSYYSDANATLPAVNVKETKNDFLVEVAAPGMNKEDFKIDYDNGRLTISSERKNESKEKDGERITRHEFSYQSFKRSFTISENVVQSDKIEASYKNGILKITLPKRDEIKPKPTRSIEIL